MRMLQIDKTVICFYYQSEHIAWNTVHSSATMWFGYRQVELQ